MKTGELYINGVDAWTEWGVFLEDGSIEKLLAGETMKPYTENTSRSIDGKQVLIKKPRYQDRDFVIVFCFSSRHDTPFLNRLVNFKETLKNGKIVNEKIYPVDMTVTELNMTFRVIFQASMTLSQGGMKIGKLGVKFNEINPANRQ